MFPFKILPTESPVLEGYTPYGGYKGTDKHIKFKSAEIIANEPIE